MPDKIKRDYGSPRWSAEMADCSMPMTLDTYSNCSYGCIYCFSQYQRAVSTGKDAYLKKIVRSVNVEKVKKIFLKPDSSQFGEYIKARKVIQWGGLSDQFDQFERRHGVTLELLRFFKSIDYPISFSTKGVWWLEDQRYTELFANQTNWNVKLSIITLDEQKARIVERGVPTPKARLNAIEKFANLNAGGATLRLRPFIIGITTPSYLELIQKAADAGATAMSTEFFCLEQRSLALPPQLKIMSDLCGFDMLAFYKKCSSGSGYLRLSRPVKLPFMNNMKELCDKIGMRFYVSDAHFKELCNNGSCCGLPPSWNYSRGQWTEALMIAKKEGKVKFSQINTDIDQFLDNFKIHAATGFNINTSEKKAHFYGMTGARYLRWLWNNPQAGQSPYKLFEGIITPNGQDENGDLIYFYTPAP